MSRALAHHPVVAGLATEVREGVPHYRPGQIAAWRDRGHGILRWVDRGGHAWVMLAEERKDGGWDVILATRVGQVTRTPWGPPPDAFRLTDSMRAALDAAEPIGDIHGPR